HSVEVQCKALEFGAGRKIPNRLFEKLAADVLSRLNHSSRRGTIAVEVDDRIVSRDIHGLSRGICNAFIAGDSKTRTRGCEVRIQERTDGIRKSDLVQLSRRNPSRPHQATHLAFLGTKEEPNMRIVLTARSRRDDRILQHLKDQLIAASAQITGT